ncbi:polysaccharide pyruvyl transferase family protein [Pseudomonas sp. CCC3.1]|uniref:polysaccharide pyruvyl transferase family protein n=1 Tax=Pseudomonas sp. CCC3.1 TaxID=3048607 RepID=UPI002AC8AF99|nr:polysaccharide pyruvyl transferase family protein [Pseudomonas sp. CCC3.1]MEB0205865.1 polysaccharide pyruvyl transferase family protein [Pseudomonas sp. CCC3.1]WPX34554.1 polysaccharide pyruvyl transferase family protein [Pseudomonas sp. CCC3.1]
MLNTFWWRPGNEKFNLGDEITTFLLSELFSVNHQLTSLDEAKLISTGSILQSIWGNRYLFRRKPIGVVGSGFIYTGMKLRKLKFSKIYSVRGHLSRQLITDKYPNNILLGDPGLLVPLALGDLGQTVEKKYKYGIIPHFTKFDTEDQNEKYKALGSYRVIDFRTNDFKKIASEILSCEVIMSQALHGLILSDAFQIPNIWLDEGSLHTGGNFKFHDYFSSVGRPFNLKINPSNDFSNDLLSKNTFTVNKETLDEIQLQAMSAFEQFFTDFNISYKTK